MSDGLSGDEMEIIKTDISNETFVVDGFPKDNRPDLFDEVIKLSKRVHVLESELADYKRLEINMSLRLNGMDETVDEIKDVLLKLAESGRLRGNG